MKKFIPYLVIAGVAATTIAIVFHVFFVFHHRQTK
jgi:hypothetical protein